MKRHGLLIFSIYLLIGGIMYIYLKNNAFFLFLCVSTFVLVAIGGAVDGRRKVMEMKK